MTEQVLEEHTCWRGAEMADQDAYYEMMQEQYAEAICPACAQKRLWKGRIRLVIQGVIRAITTGYLCYPDDPALGQLKQLRKELDQHFKED